MDDSPKNVVYFIKSDNGLIKIGYTSSSLAKRLTQLRTGGSARLHVAGYLVGGRDLEAELHSRFAPFRSHLEWFRCVPDIKEFIRANCLSWEKLGRVKSAMIRARAITGETPTCSQVLCRLVLEDSRTNAEIATAAGMSPAQFSHIMTGHRADPSVSTVARILAALGKSWRHLDPPAGKRK